MGSRITLLQWEQYPLPPLLSCCSQTNLSCHWTHPARTLSSFVCLSPLKSSHSSQANRGLRATVPHTVDVQRNRVGPGRAGPGGCISDQLSDSHGGAGHGHGLARRGQVPGRARHYLPGSRRVTPHPGMDGCNRRSRVCVAPPSGDERLMSDTAPPLVSG